jgi:hypothetical protein
MDKWEFSVIGLSEVRCPGKGKLVSGNFTVFYSDAVKAEKGVALVFCEIILLKV